MAPLGKGTCPQAWQLEFHFWNLHGGKRELTLDCCSLMSKCMLQRVSSLPSSPPPKHNTVNGNIFKCII